MNGSLKLLAPLAAALAIAACNAGGSSSIPATGVAGGTSASSWQVPQWQAQHLARAACPQVVGRPYCLALIATKGVTPLCSPSGGTCGFTPAELEQRYGLPSSTNGSGQVVAVVDAYDEPDAASDLATYRSEFGLGTANFTKYNEHGVAGSYPQSCAGVSSGGWCIEEDLDIEMVSASCPKCTIYLIESDGSIGGMEEAEASAVSLGATIVSNSWACGSNDCGDTHFSSYFDTSGIAYLASSGDSGYNRIGAPAVLGSVIAVGGTQLHKSGSTYTETIWADAGGGCASGVTKPSWQHDPDCTGRTVSDVSAQAGLSPGVAEYDSNAGGWFGVGGTSVSSPFTAGVIGLAGNAASQDGGENFWNLTKAQHAADFFHPEGDDGSCKNYLCGHKRYDKYYSGPGGWGSPNGISAY